jgi:hypothetical protein
MSHTNPAHALTPYSFQIYIYVVAPSTPSSTELFNLLKFSYLKFICISYLFRACYIPRPVNAETQECVLSIYISLREHHKENFR